MPCLKEKPLGPMFAFWPIYISQGTVFTHDLITLLVGKLQYNLYLCFLDMVPIVLISSCATLILYFNGHEFPVAPKPSTNQT